MMIDLDSGKFTNTECAECSNVVWNKKSSLFAESHRLEEEIRKQLGKIGFEIQ